MKNSGDLLAIDKKAFMPLGPSYTNPFFLSIEPNSPKCNRGSHHGTFTQNQGNPGIYII